MLVTLEAMGCDGLDKVVEIAAVIRKLHKVLQGR